jgi:hypothetical protein
VKNYVHRIARPNPTKRVVLFGNCHVAPIAYYLDSLSGHQWDIVIIVSWVFQLNGFSNFDMRQVNETIQAAIAEADLFVYQRHVQEYGVQADRIQTFVKKNDAAIFVLPNLRLNFLAGTPKLFAESLQQLRHCIETSDFPEFLFVVEHIRRIRFFCTELHPTDFVLFLLSVAVHQKSLGAGAVVLLSIDSYFDDTLREEFLLMMMTNSSVSLPGLEEITLSVTEITGIPCNVDSFGLPLKTT